MANTIIQIKRSTVTSEPSGGSLSAAEPAYSYVSGKLFLGSSDGSGVVEVGGNYLVNQSNAAFGAANAAFLNSNNSFNAANSGFNAANSAFLNSNSSYTAANAAFLNSNNAFNAANAGYIAANAAFLNSNVSFDAANAAFLNSNVSFDTANAAFLNSNAAFDTANAAYDKANTANIVASSAFDDSNTRLSTSGGTIVGALNLTGDFNVTGNVNITGNVVSYDTISYSINDPILLLANNNITDVTDIGLVAHYANAGSQQVHTGIYRDHTSKEWYLFKEYTDHFLDTTNHIDPQGNNFTLDVLNTNLRTSNIILGGANAILWLQSISGTANAAFLNSNVSFNAANAGFNAANAAFLNSNNTFNAANAAFLNSNNAFNTANAGFNAANAAFLNSNVSFDAANAAFLNSNVSYDTANAAFLNSNVAFNVANSAFDFANTANINAANASYLSVGTVPSGRLTGTYAGITGLGTITVGTWTANTVNVPYGGTGKTSFTTNGVLFGNGSGSISVTAAGTEGQVLQATSSGVPQFAHLNGGDF